MNIKHLVLSGGGPTGLLTYGAAKYNLSTEVVAILLPAAAFALSYLSTKIGDKNTALLIDLATKAVAAKPAKKK